ncbi:5'-Nucleotidase domain protein [Gloeothece citriformis PCC 7424]|uniref:5'-Nucleotidase domain protein n=1 Tax=Gloeothece citriformis (strain PCC 7424) TaxID=65393 RepID=B7KGQ4_GLOC7|nr:5'-nucleotidase C-terminal domain-containing protein [Gloeothece citriformis]ACK71981.1 5'-Nucleotidase domain protein [Gloeothece citriformis PCC 7424]
MTNNVTSLNSDQTILSSAFTLQLLHASDFEAAIPALEDAPRFSAVLNALRNQDNDGDGQADYANTLFLSSGDNYIPGVWSFASNEVYGSQGRADIAILNELGLQASAFGNHEFDLGTGVVANILAPDAEDGYGGAQFPYLSANLDFSTDSTLDDFVTADGQPASTITGKIAKSTVITVNGEQIGIVGATTPILRSISSPGGALVTPQGFPQNPTDADIQALAAIIQTSVDQLLANNPQMNKVILLSHMQQLSIEEALAGKLRNVDIIVAGGSHSRLLDQSDRLRAGDTTQGTYPIFKTDAQGNPIAIVNTDANYKYVGRLVIDFDENGLIIPGSYNAQISGAYATDQQGVAAVGGTPDPEVVAITNALQQEIAQLEGNFFGITNQYLNGNRAGTGVDGVRNQETNLGNLTADANLAIAQDFDPNTVISLKNGGGIRNSIGQIEVIGTNEPERLPPAGNDLTAKPDGGISQLDIANALSFNNGLSLVTLTAQELLDILEYGIAASTNAASSSQGRFPQVGGLAFSFDLDLPAGDRIQSLAIKNSQGNTVDIVVSNGELVGNPQRTFRMVTLNFLADGGDGYTIPNRDRVDLAQSEDAPRTGTATFAPDGSEQDALAEYLNENFLQTPFAQEDTSRELDQRIQNLDFRQDTVNDNLIAPQLNAPVYRFYNPITRGYFFTSNIGERDNLLANPQSGYNFEGVAFNASNSSGNNLVAVYRFYNPIIRGHFFTANLGERDNLLANPQFSYNFQGVGFYAYGAEASLGADVYRFYNPISQQHFLTANLGERANLLANPQFGYNFQGVGFEATPV